MTQGASKAFGKPVIRVVVIVAVLGLGLLLKSALAGMKQAPKQAEVQERAIQVEVTRMAPEDVPVSITGYGEARALDVVRITPEVAGNVVEIHPRLYQGEVIPKGELLFRIDPRDYQSAKAQAEAQAAQLKSSLGRMKTEYDVARSRLETLRRSRDLAKGEYDRVKTLLHQDDVGTQSGVDNAEMAFNQANDAFDQLSQAVELYPMRINEAASALDSAEAQLDLAKTRLERTEVRALFDARVKEKQVELGQYVAPGAPVLTLANDAVLEISVSLDSRDARSWLQFDGDHSPNDSAWFGQIARVPCRISWTEDTGKHYWQGTLDRVEQFDQTTRTLTVAVRVDSPDALSGEDRFPLVDGMFCQVDIPGATLKQVYRLPRWAVSFEGQAYVAEDKHLKTRDVEVVRSQGEESFVSQGLSPGDLVVTTRLVNPLPNSLLDFTLDEAPAASQKAQAGGEPAASAETSS